MNKLFYSVILISLVLSACNDGKKEEKALQQEVLNIHEKVMADDEKAMVNKMKLDTMLQQAKTLKTDSTAIKSIRTKLMFADDAMSFWMSKFNPDYSGKSHDEIMKYLTDQRLKVKRIDSLLVSANGETTDYLQKVRK